MYILVAGTNVDPVMRCSWWKRIVEQVYFIGQIV